MNKRRPVLLTVACVALQSCAHVKTSALGAEENYDGIRYHPPMPHVLIAPSSSGPRAEIVMLPDMGHPRVLSWSAGVNGSIHPKFTLADGWNLVGMEATIDSGTAPGIEALAALASAASLAEVESTTSLPILKPLRWTGTGWSLPDLSAESASHH